MHAADRIARPVPRRSARIVVAGLAPLLLSACIFVVDADSASWWHDHGHSLEHSHVEEHPVPDSPQTLEVRVGAGHVEVQPADDAGVARIEVLEEVAGDGYAVFEDGVLHVRSHGAGSVDLGNVDLRVRGTIGDLTVTTGAGDARVHDVPIASVAKVTTGAGDVRVSAIGTPHEVRLSTGVGDIAASDFTCGLLRARSGAGDLTLTRVDADHSEVSNGVGDLRTVDCNLGGK